MIPELYVGPGAPGAALRRAAELLGHAPTDHPDARVLSAEGADIGIDQVRDLILWARYGPALAPRKVALIGPAERLTREAANALLKLLEELPPHLAAVLFAEALDQVLPTVRSRCALRWSGGGEEPIRAALRTSGYDEEEIAFLLSFLDRDEDAAPFLAARRNPRKEWEEAVAGAEKLDLVGLAKELAERAGDPLSRWALGASLARRLPRAGADEVLQAMEALARGGKETVATFLTELARVLVWTGGWPDVPLEKRLEWAHKASLARGELEDNANPRLLAEVVALWPRRP
ncbi:MAG: hypothetical protein N2320_00060 [Candidatus Bipolaricaulota bacterium]|nr:hypothetical protein [Candidatus Bipolaricaulota bacterium]